MAEISVLKSKRGNLKGKITRLKNYFDSISRDNLNENIVSELEIRLERIQPLYDEFDDIQSQIEELENNSAEFQPNEAERGEFEATFFYLCGGINAWLKEFKNNINEERQSGSVVSSRHNSQVVNSAQSLVKLPPIKLPIFDGQYGNWLEFKDSFVALVDGDNSLNNIQKFYYLRSSLSKEVLEVIKSIEVSDSNYIVAWQFLKDRFENKKLIIYNHIRAIFEHPSLSKESYVELRNLYDSTTKHLRALKSLGENTDAWDRLIIYIISNKFDNITRRDWETYRYVGELPTMGDLNVFLKCKCETLEKLEASCSNGLEVGPQLRNKKNNKIKSGSYLAIENKPNNKFKCYFCNKESHGIFKCDLFLKLPVHERITAIKERKLCLNCLRDTHLSWKCPKSKCIKCNKPHNSLLHSDSFQVKNQVIETSNGANVSLVYPENRSGSNNGNGPEAPDYPINYASQCGVASLEPEASSTVYYSQILLSTAVIKIITKQKTVTVRALLDSGSQSNFISQKLCEKLGLEQFKINHAVLGVGQTLTNINTRVNLRIKSCVDDNFHSSINCLVLPCITDRLPTASFSKEALKIPLNLPLADPKFNISQEIDILLGSDIFWSVMGSNQIQLGPKMPTLQETKFGYIIAGNIKLNLSLPNKNNKASVNYFSVLDSDDSINNKIAAFWEIEEVNTNFNGMSPSEKYCENYFNNTTKRDQSGRFEVRIPFKENLILLGDSRKMALNRFYSLERRLHKNINLKKEYLAFMSEYENLGHMSEIKDKEGEGYYLPHHAVIKNTSLTTKCRVVFDGSAKTTSGFSLNDVQFIGPTLQQDVFSILVRFRIYEYVLTGDICKMYRQILVNSDETKFQKLFWRSHPDEELRTFKLNTVTYGTASAPYLAVRCLFQIAVENEEKFPFVSNIIRKDFYMDDLLTGSNSKIELLQIQRDITKLLADYGFELRKFLSNDRELLNSFEVNKELKASILNLGENEPNKTLGVFWDANNDHIKYRYNNTSNSKLTKRTILSLICQIFDPLGLLGPIIIVAKLIIQELWKSKVGWDDEITSNLKGQWNSFYDNFSSISELKIPRCAVVSQYVRIELHGFSDASVKAYGACIYLRCLTGGKYYSNLLCAKSRVAPLKQISLPRLELCGALLLAQLARKIIDTLEINFNNIYLWTDSTITLCWIKNESKIWKTFVANRVSEIRSITNSQNWGYVKSADNPADLLSRGASAHILMQSDLWLHGPDWFSLDELDWNITTPTIKDNEICEQKISICSTIITHSNEILSLLHRFSSLKKTLRILAYVYRFINRIKLKKQVFGPLVPEEIEKALILIVKNVQIECFPQEYHNLRNNKIIHKSSKILSLNPFLQNGVMRVGGRIKNSGQPFETKHPIILPGSHYLTKQILRNEHERLLHCGVQNLLYSVRERYWPISGRNACKNIIRGCIKCFRTAPKDTKYLMGDLPEVRVTSNSVFINVGTDYGGPFLLKDRKTRGAKIVKAYMCLFICMSTKAIHIELVSELTTQAFLAALNRFIGRRGKPKNIYSDNGSNFKGANSELLKIYEFLSRHSEDIADNLASDLIKWHFIPASSPSFGGIWEAGIKSAKAHIKRIVGDTRLTFEEFATVLTKIEGILNSRPLCPLTQEPDDLLPLTPGHFLIGKPLTRLPDIDVTDVPINRLTKWQHLQAMSQHFWRRWQKEYLSELQVRVKWKQNFQNLIKAGTMVLVKNDNLPPMNWQLGRVLTLHPGKDGVTRVVDLKVNGGTITRAINRICALPIE